MEEELELIFGDTEARTSGGQFALHNARCALGLEVHIRLHAGLAHQIILIVLARRQHTERGRVTLAEERCSAFPRTLLPGAPLARGEAKRSSFDPKLGVVEISGPEGASLFHLERYNDNKAKNKLVFVEERSIRLYKVLPQHHFK